MKNVLSSMPYIALNLIFGINTDMWFKALSCGIKPLRGSALSGVTCPLFALTALAGVCNLSPLSSPCTVLLSREWGVQI